MYSNYKALLLLSLLVVAAACKTKNNQYSNDTKTLNNYLQDVFSSSIPKDSSNFILISEYGCSGCISEALKELGSSKRSTFILSANSYSKYFKNNQTSKEKYMVDSSGRINRLNFHQNNIGIIQTANGEIFNIVFVRPSNLDSVLNIFRHS